ncbi:MAG: hypothetical protein AB3N16_05905, partial [Flavobacteriaceae bacterium]
LTRFTWLIFLVFSSCSKNDDNNHGHIPKIGSITLGGPGDNQQLVPIDIEFTWTPYEEATVTQYRLFMGLEASSLEHMTDITTGSAYTPEPLLVNTTYHWKIEAWSDSAKLAESVIQSFKTEVIAPRILTSNPGFSERYHTSVTSHNGKLWMVGGQFSESEYTDEIWSSTNGESWQLEGSFPFPISRHKLIAFNNGLWVYGGVRDTGYLTKKIYRSDDGINWTEEGDFPVWSYFHINMVVHNDRLWRVAACNGNVADLSDERHVYSSENGIDWTLETENHGFAQKYAFGITPSDNKLVGVEYDHSTNLMATRQSTDPKLWSLLGEETHTFSKSLFYPILGDLDGTLFIMGPEMPASEALQSSNGEQWQQATQREMVVQGNSYVVHNGRHLIVAGGNFERNKGNTIWVLN